MMLLAMVLSIIASDEVEARATLNDGARVTNSSTVQLKVKILSPTFPALEMQVNDGPWRPYKESQPLELSAGDGEKKVVVRLRDSTGTIRTTVQTSILFDTTPPEAKVTVPDGAVVGAVTLTSDVPDAVAMQWTEDATHWGAWAPYLTPRMVVLSPGDGAKTLLVRYRDEAGNISKPATLRVESKLESNPPGVDVEEVRVLQVPGPPDRLTVILGIPSGGMTELSLKVDEDQPLPREPYAVTRTLEIPRTGGAHRINIVLFDATGPKKGFTLAFQEADLPHADAVPTQETPAVPTRWSLSLQGGLLPSAIDFQAMTPTGNRKISKDALGLVRLSLSYEFYDPLYTQVGLEYAGGGGIRVYSGTLDVGARLFRAGPFDVLVEAGLMYSDLRTTESLFGDFHNGLGFRGGLRASYHLTPQASLEATVDYRRISYDYQESIIGGDSHARLSTVGLLLGASVRF